MVLMFISHSQLTQQKRINIAPSMFICMIYRLVFTEKPDYNQWLFGLQRGGGSRVTAVFYAEEMDKLGLKAPKHVNPRARFYFTERGWEEIGKKLVEKANKEGFKVKVIKKKNPKRSDVAYSDPYQVALLPKSKR